MAYVAQDIEHKKLGAAIGSGECVALVQAWTGAPNTGSWRQGVAVKGNDGLISKGTAIATFVQGVYPNNRSGNHAAIYISQDAQAIYVIDQWNGQGSHRRPIYFDNARSASNNGNGFYVIE